MKKYLLIACLFSSSLLSSAVYKTTPSNYINDLKVLLPGDTLLLQDGDYTKGLRLSNINGAEGKNIVICGENEHKAVLVARDGSNTCDILNCSYISIENLKFDGKNLEAIDAIKAGGSSNGWAHHIRIYNNLIVNHGGNQQTVGISTKIPCWDWIIEHNRIIGAGTGIYLGNSDGTMPFIRGMIKQNLILNPTGYCMQIKHQLNRPDIPGIPKEPGQTTYILHNTFSKDDRLSPDGDRPCLLIGGQHNDSAWNDKVEIAGNFFFNNPRENLLQATGIVSIHGNIFVNEKNGCITFQEHNGITPNNVKFYLNTVLSGICAFSYSVSSGHNAQIQGNYIFGEPYSYMIVPDNNQTGTVAEAKNFLNNPVFDINEMNFLPTKNIYDNGDAKKLFQNDLSIDFNNNKLKDPIRYGAIQEGSNEVWKYALDIKEPAPELQPKVWFVGPSRQYKMPCDVANLVNDWDTVYIDAGEYKGDVCPWTKNNLVIKGIGDGYAHLNADGKNSQGKAIWVIKGDNYWIENIEFSNCRLGEPDKNGAGIRQEGTNLEIHKCYFHHNENGILAGEDTLSSIYIYQSEFAYNGYGDGYSHNLYIGHIREFGFYYNYSHHANVGHNLKSRAEINYIYVNRIMDEQEGNSSFLIDLPNGGYAMIMRNLLMQGPNAENKKMVNFGAEGLKNKSSSLRFYNNTMVNKRQTGTFIYVQNGSEWTSIKNNIFAGVGDVLEGIASDTSNNLRCLNIQDAVLVDEENYDYHLKKGSPAINKGIFLPYRPIIQYKHPMSSEQVISDSNIDIGAYEYEGETEVIEEQYSSDVLSISPNPATDYIEISYSPLAKGARGLLVDLKIYNVFGEELLLSPAGGGEGGGSSSQYSILTTQYYKLDVSSLPPGVYFVKVGERVVKFLKV